MPPLLVTPRAAPAHSLFSSQMMHLVTLSRKIATKKQPYAYRKAVCGAPSGTRTQDPLIKSQLLYQLS